jgi:DNA polymerase
MALSLSHAYPGSLEAVGAVLGLENKKDATTAKQIKKMWKPRKAKKGEDPNVLHWEDTPELRELLYAYCKQDVVTERDLHQCLQALPPAEQDAWVIDAEINDHGVCIDAPLAKAASHLAAKALLELDEQIVKYTDGVVGAASQVSKLKAWLLGQRVALPKRPKKLKGGIRWEWCLEADDIEKLLTENVLAKVRTVLEIRLKAAQSAARKVNRMLTTQCADGRVRNLYRMYGAVTGRWSGEGFQPQNLKRPKLLQSDEAIDEAIALVLAEDYTGIQVRHGDVLGVIGDLCRSMIIPAPGHRFIVGDFTAIEARVLTWLAGDTHKLEAFRQFDAGTGRDLYCVAAEQVLGVTNVTPKSPERALGKVFELGLGYAMGPERLLTTIRRAGIANATLTNTTAWVKAWRRQNPAIVNYWAALNAAAIAAVGRPGIPVIRRAASFEMRDGVLYMRLPSGRELSYPAPRIISGNFGHPQVIFPDMEAGRQRGKQMHGGKWAENITSAVARDLLVEAMKRLRAAGYTLVLHTHDEIGAEMPIGAGDKEEFKQLLTEAPSWADGLPIAAKVFECERFKKD